MRIPQEKPLSDKEKTLNKPKHGLQTIKQLNLRTKLLCLLGLALLIAFVCFWGSGLDVTLSKVEQSVLSDTFKEKGFVKNGNRVTIHAQVSGDISQLLVKKNQHVKRGDIIAIVDDKDYTYQKKQYELSVAAAVTGIDKAKQDNLHDKQELRNELDTAKIELQQLTGRITNQAISDATSPSPESYLSMLEMNMQLEENALQFAQKDYDIQKSLHSPGYISDVELKEAENRLAEHQVSREQAYKVYADAEKRLKDIVGSDVSQDDINALFYGNNKIPLEGERDKLQSQIELLEMKLSNDYLSHALSMANASIESERVLLKKVEDQIADCSIKAESDGIIVELPVENIDSVTENEPVAVISGEGKQSIEVKVLTSAEPFLKVGDKVKLCHKLKSGSTDFEGTITQIYDYAEIGTSALGLDEYRVTVCIEPEGDVFLKDGYQIEAEFQSYYAENVLCIPSSAVFREDNQDYVFRMSGRTAVKTPVVVGYRATGRCEISEGLKLGDTVIQNVNIKGLKDGARVPWKPFG